MAKKHININAQKHILNNKDKVNSLGVWKGYKYSKAIKRILCRKCLNRVMIEFDKFNPNPNNPSIYCSMCRLRLEKLTKDTYEAE